MKFAVAVLAFLLAQSVGAQVTLPTWQATSGTYTYTMVGQSPMTAGSGTTTINVPIVPLRLVFADGTVLDPSVVDSGCSSEGSALSLLEQSPIFNNSSSTGGTQYEDFFRRSNFWQYTSVNPNYHLLLNASPTATVTITVPSANGHTTAASCGRLGEMDLGWFDTYLQSTVIPQVGIAATDFPVFLLYNAVTFEASAPAALNLGYHSGFPNAVTGRIQIYAVGDFDTTKSFGVTKDVSDLTHEIAEGLDDPLGNNPTPAWGNIGQVSGCQDNLEVGDPLSGTDITVTMPNLYTYHLQELAFVSWFYNDLPSKGINGWYSSNGTFLTSAAPCGGAAMHTSTSLTLSAATVTAGTQVSFAATVTPASATGSIALLTSTGTTLGTFTLADGIANGKVTLPAGSYTVTAQYAGGGIFAASISSPVAVTATAVQLKATVTTLTASPTAIPSGGQVTIAIKVTPPAATGTVTLVTGTVTSASLPLLNGVFNGSISLPRGTYTITAEYQGDTTFAASNSAPVTINPALQSTVTTLSLSSVVSGSATTASVQVSPASATGTVSLVSNTGNPLATLRLANGTASSTFTLPGVFYTVTAQYSGDATYAASSSTPVTINPPAPTVTTLTLTSAVAGSTTTASVKVSPATATGMVALVSSTGSTLAKLTLTNGAANSSLALPAGAYTVTAQYSGDGAFAPSNSSPVAINPAMQSTVTTLSLSSTTSGGLTSASVHVSPASATGVVTIGTLGTLALAGGAASALFDLPPGTYAVTATYSGDTAFAGSTSAAVTVSPQLKLSTPSLSFGGAQTLTISNTSATNALVLIGATGKDPADFSWTRGCPLFLAAGKSCSIQVKFAPLASGVRTAALLVGGFVEASRQTVSLTGGP